MRCRQPPRPAILDFPGRPAPASFKRRRRGRTRVVISEQTEAGEDGTAAGASGGLEGGVGAPQRLSGASGALLQLENPPREQEASVTGTMHGMEAIGPDGVLERARAAKWIAKWEVESAEWIAKWVESEQQGGSPEQARSLAAALAQLDREGGPVIRAIPTAHLPACPRAP